MELGKYEEQFANIIWENAPLSTAVLIKISEETFAWKRTTTYTVLKRLCNRGLFSMQNHEVTVLISKEEFYAAQSEAFVEKKFHGSLPAFLTAFTRHQKLSESEIREIMDIISNSHQ